MKTGLVLEGGGMRGVYTTGALDCFQDNGLTFDYVIGVSAGACHATSYLSGQRGRSFQINVEYSQDKRYISLGNYLKTKSVFGMDFIFHEIPDRLLPFDYEAMGKNPTEFVVGVTDVLTGRPFYFTNPKTDMVNTVVAASSAIPIFSPMVEIEGKQYLDGGTTDPIPVKKALEDGCDRVVVILTRPRGYQKQPEGFRKIYRRKFKKYPAMVEALDRRHEIYNDTLKFIETLEKEGHAIVLAQTSPIPIGRFEKDPAKLRALYELGMKDAANRLDEIRAL